MKIDLSIPEVRGRLQAAYAIVARAKARRLQREREAREVQEAREDERKSA
jgi:hypothetical protein